MTWAFQPLLPGAAQSQGSGGATLTAEGASFTLGGQAASPRRTARLAAAPGSFAASGMAAAFKRVLRFEAESAAFAFTGAAVQFGTGGPVRAVDARALDLGFSLGL